MKEIIITTPEELRTLIAEAIKTSVQSQKEQPTEQPDTITLTVALDILRENGYPTSKGKIYKLTSANLLPHRKYGNKLVFSRREILAWANHKPISNRITPSLFWQSPKVPAVRDNQMVRIGQLSASHPAFQSHRCIRVFSYAVLH